MNHGDVPMEMSVDSPSSYEDLVVEMEFKNNIRITLSKEPGDKEYYVLFENFNDSTGDALNIDYKQRLPVRQVQECISKAIAELEARPHRI